MGTIVDYGTLKTAVADYINRKDLTARIPDFISFGEGDIFRGFMTRTGNISLRCRINIESADLVPVDGVMAIPSNYRELISATMADRFLQPMSEQFYNKARLYTGQTSAYAQIDDNWRQYPQSDTDDTFDVRYFADYTGTLVNDTDTNPVLTALPELYLFAALAEAETYIKNDARAATWGNKLESNIRGCNADYRRSIYSGATPAQRTQYREVQTTRTFNHGST